MSSIDIQQQQRTPQPVISVRQTMPIAELQRFQGEGLTELWRLLHDRGVKPAGAPFVRYHTFGDAETDVEIGVPVPERVAGAGRVTSGELPGGPVAVTTHLGAHDRLGDAYGRIQGWLAGHGEPAGPGWEVYEWIDLTQEPDPSSWPPAGQWRTELVQPIT
jgi:effector-binding domain-containing protein